MALSFDLEFDDDHLLCAATFWTNGFIDVPQLFVTQEGTKFTNLSSTSLESLIETLWAAHCFGTVILTWGGTGSDWKKLAKAAPQHADKIKEMALNSVDIPLIAGASTGMMMGLSAAAVGMGLGPQPSCDSIDVPAFWKGDVAKQNMVVDHVRWDAWACAQIYSRLMLQINHARPQLSWMTQKSGVRSIRLRKEKIDDEWALPRIHHILEWEKPVTAFIVPDHLEPSKMLQWLN
jgi:hypothetical protein